MHRVGLARRAMKGGEAGQRSILGVGPAYYRQRQRWQTLLTQAVVASVFCGPPRVGWQGARGEGGVRVGVAARTARHGQHGPAKLDCSERITLPSRHTVVRSRIVSRIGCWGAVGIVAYIEVAKLGFFVFSLSSKFVLTQHSLTLFGLGVFACSTVCGTLASCA